MVTLTHTSLYIPEDFRKTYDKFMKIVGERKISKTIRDLIENYVHMEKRLKGDE